jgi:hypothetical protein
MIPSTLARVLDSANFSPPAFLFVLDFVVFVPADLVAVFFDLADFIA